MSASPPRPVFVVHLKPEPGINDAIRQLRGFLKLALRRFGLRHCGARG
jgi:hypothetical protein